MERGGTVWESFSRQEKCIVVGKGPTRWCGEQPGAYTVSQSPNMLPGHTAVLVLGGDMASRRKNGSLLDHFLA